jgi:hypothetical protein
MSGYESKALGRSVTVADLDDMDRPTLWKLWDELDGRAHGRPNSRALVLRHVVRLLEKRLTPILDILPRFSFLASRQGTTPEVILRRALALYDTCYGAVDEGGAIVVRYRDHTEDILWRKSNGEVRHDK